FYAYIERTQNNGTATTNLERELEAAYDAFTHAELLEYEKTRLDKKYPEFKLLAREYYEGILLFDLTEKMVWRKSVSDTVGLKKFYEQNRENYQWDTRYDMVF